MIRAAQLGNETAFRALYREMQPRLLRYLTARIGTEAEDVASECWLRVARDLDTFRGDIDDFWLWTVTIARYRAIDHLRRKDRLPLADVRVEDLTELAGPEDPAALTLDRISTERTLALIGTLPPDQAEAVLLRVVLGFEPARAAQILGKRPGAVRTAAYRGLRALARRFETRREARYY
ncbi:MAG TPA: RNA polymerase sigma factor [Streptosporangiaceae bacterium]